MSVAVSPGPLAGLRVIELDAIGSLPFAAMLLADLGADVVRIDRPDRVGRQPQDVIEAARAGLDHLGRGRRRLALDLKRPEGKNVLLRMVAEVDVFLESNRPGVVERLGVGPDDLLAVNPRLIYGRVSGWGRTGPLADAAGHDITYCALAGVTHTLRPAAGGPPVQPFAHIGDLGGGGMLLLAGVLAALHERARSGLGQVVDTSILDGAVLLNSLASYVAANSLEHGPPGTNAVDGGSHYYRAYECSDGQHIVFGALEPEFHDRMLRALGIDPTQVDQHDRSSWQDLSRRVADIIGQHPQAHWATVFAATDACFADRAPWGGGL